jgi:hypothetical protein
MHNQPNPLITAKNERRADALGVPRVMQPVKGPFSVSVPATPAAQPSQPSQPAQPPAPAQPAPQSQQDILITRLLALPEMIRNEQASFDAADFTYREALARITIRAFSEPLFPGKKEGEGLRPASNDTEREAAISRLATTDSELMIAAQRREIMLRALMQVKNEFQAAQLVAQLLISQSKGA